MSNPYESPVADQADRPARSRTGLLAAVFIALFAVGILLPTVFLSGRSVPVTQQAVPVPPPPQTSPAEDAGAANLSEEITDDTTNAPN